MSTTTDAEWEKWGRQEPYFGVITNPKFRLANLDVDSRREFFESGRWHAQYVFDICRRHLAADFAPRSALDFGCGVGRVLVPLAQCVEQVVGVDVSPSMLQEAQRNCERYSVGNVRLAVSDDSLSTLDQRFDLVHSAIVFQHIEPLRGRSLFARLLECIAPGGVGALQVTYAKSVHAENWGLPPDAAAKMALAQPPSAAGQDPHMQMNPYILNHLMFALQRAGVVRVHTEFTDHGGELGVFLFFQMPTT